MWCCSVLNTIKLQRYLVHIGMSQVTPRSIQFCVFSIWSFAICKSTQITFHFNKSTDSWEEALLNNLNVIRTRLLRCLMFWILANIKNNLKLKYSAACCLQNIIKLYLEWFAKTVLFSSKYKNGITYLCFWLSYTMTILIDRIDGLLWSNLFVLLNIPRHCPHCRNQ